MVATRRLKEIVDRIATLGDFPDSALLIGLSGGPDSAALAFLATQSGGRVRAAHVDHGTPFARQLRDAARATAEILDMELELVKLEPLERFSEDRARRARYDALLGLLEEDEWLVTGHTLDDQAETLLMNMIRGSGLSGLAGIPRRTPNRVARPLLGVSRGELRELATLAGLPFRDDPSNMDLSMTRNRIRHEVLPALTELNPRVVEALVRLADTARADEEFLQALASVVPMSLDAESATIPTSVVTTESRPVADRALRRIVSHLRPPYPPSREELDRIREVAVGAARRAEIEGGIVVTSERGLLRFAKDGDAHVE